MNLRLTPMQVATGSNDTESQLVFHDGFLVAVLVRLSDDHEVDAGRWFLEAVFGRIDSRRHLTFVDLDEARAWITDQLA